MVYEAKAEKFSHSNGKTNGKTWEDQISPLPPLPPQGEDPFRPCQILSLCSWADYFVHPFYHQLASTDFVSSHIAPLDYAVQSCRILSV